VPGQVEIHAAFGSHHKVRLPRYGRDMAYHRPSCDLFIGGSTPSVYRLNLDQGRFMVRGASTACAATTEDSN
jgi:ribosome biogenesis protein ENP2